VTLADQIIEHGQFLPGDVMHVNLGEALMSAPAMNALRDELIELRRLRAADAARERYGVSLNLWMDQGPSLDCRTCGAEWPLSDDDSLPDLVRRADQHTEGCA
jgi:hypothetical protein